MAILVLLMVIILLAFAFVSFSRTDLLEALLAVRVSRALGVSIRNQTNWGQLLLLKLAIAQASGLLLVFQLLLIRSFVVLLCIEIVDHLRRNFVAIFIHIASLAIDGRVTVFGSSLALVFHHQIVIQVVVFVIQRPAIDSFVIVVDAIAVVLVQLWDCQRRNIRGSGRVANQRLFFRFCFRCFLFGFFVFRFLGFLFRFGRLPPTTATRVRTVVAVRGRFHFVSSVICTVRRCCCCCCCRCCRCEDWRRIGKRQILILNNFFFAFTGFVLVAFRCFFRRRAIAKVVQIAVEISGLRDILLLQMTEREGERKKMRTRKNERAAHTTRKTFGISKKME
jgi:hypothetical protein